MSKKVYMLISGIVGGVAAIAEAIVAFTQPEYAVQIAVAIPIVAKCIDEVCFLFVPTDK